MQFSTLLTTLVSLAATAASTATVNKARQEGQLAGIATFYGDESCETEVVDTTEVTFDLCYNFKEHYQATFFSATLGGEQEFESRSPHNPRTKIGQIFSASQPLSPPHFLLLLPYYPWDMCPPTLRKTAKTRYLANHTLPVILFEDENCEGAVTVIDSHSCDPSTTGLSFSARLKE